LFNSYAKLLSHSRVQFHSFKNFPGISCRCSVFQFLLECPSMGLITLAYKLTLKITAMKNFVKNYIGKGKKVEGLEIIKINFKIEDLVKFSHKYKDEDYITIEIAKLKNPDKFGHDYTAYVNRLEEEQVSETAPAIAPKKQSKKSKASKEKVNADLPF
jgi:hypothetical protein